jgi:uncharacterized protein YbjQ (UPF0145 family)
MNTAVAPYRAPAAPEAHPVFVTTAPEVPGHRVALVLGVVHGFGLRPRPQRTTAKTIEEANAARHAAFTDLVAEATRVGADAIVGFRYDSDDGYVVACGTAVRVEAMR